MKPAAQMKELLVPVAVLFLVFSQTIAAQKHASNSKPTPLTSHQLISLKISGTTRYTDKEILAASGLQLGKDAAEGDFKEAAQRLGQSGLFSGVVYSFSYSDAGVKVEFQLTDNEKNSLCRPTLKTSSGSRTPNSSPLSSSVCHYSKMRCQPLAGWWIG